MCGRITLLLVVIIDLIVATNRESFEFNLNSKCILFFDLLVNFVACSIAFIFPSSDMLLFRISSLSDDISGSDGLSIVELCSGVCCVLTFGGFDCIDGGLDRLVGGCWFIVG